MSRIKANISITSSNNNESYVVNAIRQNNILKYYENDNTKVIFDINNNQLVRENKELKIIYHFEEDNNTKGLVEIKELAKEVVVDIKTISIHSNEDIIDIKYQVGNDMFNYKIEVLK